MRWIAMDSPIGPLLLAARQGRLCAIEFGADEAAVARLESWARKACPSSMARRAEGSEESVLALASEQLLRYFAGEKFEFDVPLELMGTPFQVRVWEALRAIPYGEVRSYKDVAEAIGAPKAVRAVGGANHRNPIPIIVPCHRVIGASGALVGYGGGLHIKEHLLGIERADRQAVGWG